MGSWGWSPYSISIIQWFDPKTKAKALAQLKNIRIKFS